MALFLAYKETIKNHDRFILGSFLNLVFEYTIMLVITVVSAFGENKSGNSSGNTTNSNKTITNVLFRKGFATVFYSYDSGKGSFTVACNEVVNWTGESVTVKVRTGSSTLVKRMNPSGGTIDTYFE